jgi:hypothetical protein
MDKAIWFTLYNYARKGTHKRLLMKSDFASEWGRSSEVSRPYFITRQHIGVLQKDLLDSELMNRTRRRR